jgi:predicted outer membrane repeat protein
MTKNQYPTFSYVNLYKKTLSFLVVSTFIISFIINYFPNIKAYAGVITVGNGTAASDCNENALSTAIKNASSGDIISLNCPSNTKITLSKTLEINKDLNIQSSGQNCITLSGDGKIRIIQVGGLGTKVKLSNLILANGKTSSTNAENPESDNAGGAILTGNESQLTLDDVQFNNNAAGVGGAIYLGFKSTLNITNSKFDNNQALAPGSITERSGGAIATKAGSSVTIKTTDFANNKGGIGGALNILLSSLDVQDSLFKNNSTNGGVGGAIYTDGASELINDNVGGKIVIKNSRFEGNNGGDGGAIYPFMYNLDSASIENVSFVNNTSSGSGGAIRAGNSNLEVLNSTFVGNKAKNGGAAMLQNEGNILFNNVLFANNEALEQGGVVVAGLNSGFNVTFDSVTMSNNRSNQYAGAIANQGMQEANIITQNSVYVNNTSGNQFNSAINVYGPITDNGNNFQFPNTYLDTTEQGYTNVTNQITITDPELTSFLDSGGSLQTTGCVTQNAIKTAGSGFKCSDNSGNKLGSKSNSCVVTTENISKNPSSQNKIKNNIRTGGSDN